MRGSGKSFAARVCAAALLVCALGNPAKAATNRPLSEALLELRRQGLNVVFSSTVVRADMRVVREPSSRTPRRKLEELLAPHALAVAEGPSGVLVVVVARHAPAQAPEPSQETFTPVWTQEITVQPSRITLLLDEPYAPATLVREEIEAIPHLGDDVFRTLSVLPGTASTDVSAQVHVRGGRRDELLVRLDGQELYEPYHLRDFDNVLSIVGASTLAEVDLITAAFPAAYGGRSGGVLDMVTVAPPEEETMRVTASIHGAQLDASGGHRQRLQWLASLRRGSTDLLGRALDVESPRFWDFFGKAAYEVSPRQSFRLHALTSSDRLDFTDPEARRLDTEYVSSYVWGTHQLFAGGNAHAQSTLSVAQLEHDRRGFELDEERTFDVVDERVTHVTAFSHAWTLSLGRSLVEGGVQRQSLDTRFDYDSSRHFSTPLVIIRAEPRDGAYSFHDRVESDQTGVWFSNRVRLGDDVTLDAGLRYERLLTPRLHAAWRFAPSSVARLAYGRFTQSQRSYELMVEDADVRRYPTERAEHVVAAVDHVFGDASRVPLAFVRAEVYRKSVKNPRPRYESLFKPFDPFPEGEIDRVRLAPETSTAKGVEVLIQGRPAGRFSWWLNYALASSTDRIDGRDAPRRFDQRHTMKIDLNYRLAPAWNVNAAWIGHSGWPATLVTMEDGLPVLGPLNESRLRDYHRLDVRLSREWQRRSGALSAYVDAHNVFARRNTSGLDAALDDETGELLIETESFPRFFASAGIAWQWRGR
jgi:outer membrane receptor protein involved in Fe transport